MSDLSRAREALCRAAMKRLDASERRDRMRNGDLRALARAWSAYEDANIAFEQAGDAYARAAREEGKHGKAD